MTLSRAARRAHLRTQARLLEVETTSVRRVRSAARAVLREGRDTSPAGLVATSRALREALQPAFQGAREAARAAGHATLADELAVAQKAAQRADRAPSSALVVARASAVLDDARADLAAITFAAHWLRQATAAATEDNDPAVVVQAAQGRLDAAAGAVVTEAFGEERDQELAALAAEPEGARWLPVLIKVWDARLDACPRCRALDGTLRPLGLGFPDGVAPGRVHYRCRCIAGVSFLSMAWSGFALGLDAAA